MSVPNLKPQFSFKGFRFVLICIGSAALFVFAFGALGFRINLTPSYPMGLWRIQKGIHPKKGDLVMFKFPRSNPLYYVALERGYLHEVPQGFAPMVKKLAAMPGDTVTLTDRVLINGQEWPHGEIRQVDSKGRAVARAADAGVVAEGQCWLLSDYSSRSFDSRYFGAVPLSEIFAIAKPVVVWHREF